MVVEGLLVGGGYEVFVRRNVKVCRTPDQATKKLFKSLCKFVQSRYPFSLN